MSGPRTNLEQWHCFLAVVDEGSYARAAEVLHKSQSAVTYTIQKMEEQHMMLLLFQLAVMELQLLQKILLQKGLHCIGELLEV